MDQINSTGAESSVHLSSEAVQAAIAAQLRKDALMKWGRVGLSIFGQIALSAVTAFATIKLVEGHKKPAGDGNAL
jgi:hypothetical protein